MAASPHINANAKSMRKQRLPYGMLAAGKRKNSRKISSAEFRVAPHAAMTWIDFRRERTLAIALVVCLALAVRFLFLGSQGLWFDEAWVVKTLLKPTIGDMLFSSGVSQSNPPLFLLLSRTWIGIMGFADWKIRMVSSCLNAATLLLGFVYVRRRVSLFGACVFVICWGFLESALRYAYEFKHYSAETLAVIVLLLALDVLQASSRTYVLRWCGFLLIAVVCITLSFTIAFLLPAVLGSILYGAYKKHTPSVSGAWTIVGIVATSFVLQYLFIVRSQIGSSDFLYRYWSDGFFETNPLHQSFYGEVWVRIKRLFEYFFATSWFGYAGRGYASMALFLCVATIAAVPFHKKWQVLLWASPLPFLVAAAALGLYPFHPSRTSFFLLPLILMVCAQGLELFSAVSLRHSQQIRFLFLSLLLFIPLQGLSHTYRVNVYNDGRDALLWAKKNVQEGDEVFFAYHTGYRVHVLQPLYAPNVPITGVLTSDPDEAAEWTAWKLELHLLKGHSKRVLFVAWTPEGSDFLPIFHLHCTQMSAEPSGTATGYVFDCS